MKISFPVDYEKFENLGVPNREIRLASVLPGQFIIINDEDGQTVLRLNGSSPLYFDFTVIHNCGFSENIRVRYDNKKSIETLFVGNLLHDTRGKIIFSFQDFTSKIYIVRLFDPAYDDFKIKFENNCQTEFNCSETYLKNINAISVKDWPINEPIFISDSYGIRRILFFQDYYEEFNSRKVIEIFRSGISQKIIAYTGYVSNKSVIGLRSGFFINDLLGDPLSSKSILTLLDMNIYS